MADTDAAIVGGGLAGTAAAVRLARAGCRVVLLERESDAKPKVCGEFLSGVALGELVGLGLDTGGLGAVPLAVSRLSARDRAAEAALPFPAASLTRRVLDEALLSAAARAGVDVRRGAAVRKVEPEGTAWAVRSGSGTVRADRVLVATGKSDLAGRRRSGGLHDGLVGLKRYAVLRPEAAAALAGSVELVLFPGGYCGIQPVEDGSANVCLVIEARALKSCGTDGAFHAVRRGSTRGAELLEGALWTSERPAAVGWLPYGFVQTRTDGLFRLGDQAAVIPSFCGEGMGLALSSARLAAEAVLADETAAAYQRRFARIAGARVRGAALLSRALCAGPLQPVAAATARAAPALMRGIAALTRTPPAAGSHPPHEPVLPGQGVR